MAANPSPPPGSIQVQPVSASGGSPAQSGGNATVSTGQAWAGSGSQDTTAAHCGVNASAGSTGYAAQPQQVNTSGASSPNCTSASGTGNQSTANGNQSTANGNQSTANGTQPAAGQTNPLGRTTASGTTTGSSSNALKPAASVAGLAGFAGWFGWLFLLLLLATLFLLLGFAVGRRRREPAAA
jgi:cobalamin biosynthesis Mg chelatase CobN